MEAEKKSKKINSWMIKLIAVLIAVAAIFAAFHWSDYFSTESSTAKLNFEDIGELATQVAYSKEVNITEEYRDIFGINVPFTQSKLIYSYDVVVKAGYDFAEITAVEEPDAKIINVYLPEAKVLSTELDLDSFKIYHEKESVFRPISMEENNEAMKTMEENARNDSVKNGLLDLARQNAESLLTGFIGNMYDLDVYQIRFNDKA